MTQYSPVSKLLLYLFIVMVTFSACSKYQYISLNSNLKKNSFQEYIYENDSLSVKYSFNGQNCPVTLVITNHLNVPLYVDWRKSAAIIEGQSVSYFKDETKIHMNMSGEEFQWTDFFSTQYSSIDGKITRNNSISFIPPGANIKINPIKLKNDFFKLNQMDQVETHNMPIKDGMKQVKRHMYDRSNTPFSFRSFITYSTFPDFTSATHIDHQFWADGIVQTNASPKVYHFQPTNQFYLIESTGNGAVTVIGAVALLGTAMLIEKEK